MSTETTTEGTDGLYCFMELFGGICHFKLVVESGMYRLENLTLAEYLIRAPSELKTKTGSQPIHDHYADLRGPQLQH